MSVSRIGNIIVGFHCLSALYGVSRGYRSIPFEKHINENNYILLHSLKLKNSLFNGVMYGMPFWNIPTLCNVFDRIEIEVRGLDKNLYYKSYEEWVGVCYDTL